MHEISSLNELRTIVTSRIGDGQHISLKGDHGTRRDVSKDYWSSTGGSVKTGGAPAYAHHIRGRSSPVSGRNSHTLDQSLGVAPRDRVGTPTRPQVIQIHGTSRSGRVGMIPSRSLRPPLTPSRSDSLRYTDLPATVRKDEADLDALRQRIEHVEAERFAFLQEGVFDLIRNISKVSGEKNHDPSVDIVVALTARNNELAGELTRSEAQLSDARARIVELERMIVHH